LSKLLVNELAPKTSGNKIIMPQGGIIQVQYTQFTGMSTPSLAAMTNTPLTDLTVNITPARTSSVIHLQAHIFLEFGNEGNDWEHVFFFYRDTTKLGQPAAGTRKTGISMATRTYRLQDSNSTPNIARYDYFDTPATTSAITYKVGIQVTIGDTLYINRTLGDQDANYIERGTSFISATEIAG
jgi:hypothetical protein